MLPPSGASDGRSPGIENGLRRVQGRQRPWYHLDSPENPRDSFRCNGLTRRVLLRPVTAISSRGSGATFVRRSPGSSHHPLPLLGNPPPTPPHRRLSYMLVIGNIATVPYMIVASQRDNVKAEIEVGSSELGSFDRVGFAVPPIVESLEVFRSDVHAAKD